MKIKECKSCGRKIKTDEFEAFDGVCSDCNEINESERKQLDLEESGEIKSTDSKTIKYRCKNLFCNAEDICWYGPYPSTLELNNAICPKCKQKGYMPSYHVLLAEEILLQIIQSRKNHLWKDLFKKINFDKLPKNMDQQNRDSNKRYDIDIIATGYKKEGAD